MGRLAEVSLGDLVRGLARYRPVAVVIAVIAVAAAILPAPTTTRGASDEFAFRPVQPATRAQAPDDSAEAEVATEETFTDDFSSFSPSPSAGDFESGGSSFDGSSFESSFDDSSFTFGGDGFEETEEPLQIVSSAWASRGAGTPLARSGVPDGTLPVGKRATLIDKASFIRLAGTADELELFEDGAGSRAAPAGETLVQACRIVDPAWEEGEAVAFGDAPEWDAEKCVVGERAEDGTWTFDLSAYPDRTDENGWALVPAPGSAPDFQVAFATA